jgi:hypothetical protein
VQIDVIPGIDAAKVDCPVFDHEPPVSAPAADLRIDELHGASVAGERHRFEIAPTMLACRSLRRKLRTRT